MSSQSFDAVVLGGGPAGAATALVLARDGLRVTLLERAVRGGPPRIGEVVPPGIREPLEELGLWERFHAAGHLPASRSLSAWGSSDLRHEDFLFHPYGTGWHLDRDNFDDMLLEAAEGAGVRVATGTKVSFLCRKEDGWLIETHSSAGSLPFRAPWLIDATGRSSPVHRWVSRRQIVYDRLVGLAAYLEPVGTGASPEPLTFLLEAVEDGWWSSVPLPDGRLAAVFMTDSDLLQSARRSALDLWSDRIAHAGRTAERLRSFHPPEKLLVRPAHTCCLDQVAEPGLLAVGDAAAAFDPLSSQGIFKALRSALRAGRAIMGWREGEVEALRLYEEETRSELKEYLGLRSAYYLQEGRWPSAPFWQRRRQLDSSRVRITLAPSTLVYYSEAPGGLERVESLATVLQFPELRSLCDLCRTARPAHEAAAAFKRHHPRIEDQRLVAALQLLVDNAVLTRVTGS